MPTHGVTTADLLLTGQVQTHHLVGFLGEFGCLLALRVAWELVWKLVWDVVKIVVYLLGELVV